MSSQRRSSWPIISGPRRQVINVRANPARHYKSLGAAFLLGMLLLGYLPVSLCGQNRQIVIGAAISLKESFSELGGIYERRTGTKVTFSFGASGQLEKQIEAGAPVDVFASASEREMDELQAKNLIDPATRADFARNSLLLVVPVDS